MNSVRKFSSAIVLLISLISLTAFNAEANLLTAGDFEGISTIDGYWASSAGVWGAENAALTGVTLGVTPFDSQMLQINHAGGGSVSQVHQMVAGPFTAGTTVSFEVQLNSFGPGIAAQLFFAGRDTITTPDADLVFSSVLNLDSDEATWETLSVTGTLASDYNFLTGEIRYFHNTALLVGAGFADNAVLTATAPVPEPATMLLLGTGMVGLAGFRRKKLKK